jgi:hypothetical protein
VARRREPRRVFVTGSSTNSTDTGFATIGYAPATGSPLWTRRLDQGVFSVPSAIAVGPIGDRVSVTGLTDSVGSTGLDYLTIAYRG